MKTLGIEISGSTAIFCGLEITNEDAIEITGEFKKLELEDDQSSNEVNEFKDTVDTFLKDKKFDRIAIIKRSKSTRGKFSVSPISFKLEGLIQIYKGANIEFIAPQTLAAYYKKNQFNFNPKYQYQIQSAKLAYYLNDATK